MSLPKRTARAERTRTDRTDERTGDAELHPDDEPDVPGEDADQRKKRLARNRARRSRRNQAARGESTDGEVSAA